MEIDKIFGLPAHPLFVHFAVVLVPLAAIAVIAAVVRPGWQKALRPIAVALVACSFIAVLLAAGSGEKFENRTDTTRPDALELHKDLGSATRLIVFVMLLLVIAWAVISRRHTKLTSETTDKAALSRSKQLNIASSALLVIFAVLSTVWAARTGHSGAEAVWYDTGQLTPVEK